MKQFTVVYLLHFSSEEKKWRVLLGLKKQKLCAGTYVGLGGKMLPGETIAECALREIAEEAPGISVIKESLRLRSMLDISKMTWDRYRIFVLIGKVASEILPESFSEEFQDLSWWNIDELPAKEKLPKGDHQWLPKVLDERHSTCYVRVDSEGNCSVYPNKDLRAYDMRSYKAQSAPIGASPKRHPPKKGRRRKSQ